MSIVVKKESLCSTKYKWYIILRVCNLILTVMKIPILCSVNNIILCYNVVAFPNKMTFPIMLHNKSMKYFHSKNTVCVMGLRKRGKFLVTFVLNSDQYRQQQNISG